MLHNFSRLWLDIGHRRPSDLRKMRLRPPHEGPKEYVRKRTDHIEILVHVAVVQDMMPVQAAENPRLFYPAIFG